MTLCGHTASFPQHECSGFYQTCRPEKMEGAGNAGCTSHPLPCVQNGKDARKVTTGTPKSLRHSLRNGFTAAPCSPRGTGLVSPRRLRGVSARRAVIAIPQACPQRRGDGTTRLDRTHLTPLAERRPARPPQPDPTFAANGQTPLLWNQDGRVIACISVKRKQKFWCRGVKVAITLNRLAKSVLSRKQSAVAPVLTGRRAGSACQTAHRSS
jgi:hypothetical protein